jgi:minor histocompatibility antigen H13
MVLSSGRLYWASHAVIGALLVATNYVLLPINPQMLLFTGAIICIGSHQSLKLSETFADGKRKNSETMTHKDALMFPVFGSIALLSLYLAHKFIGKWLLNLLISAYVIILGAAAVAETLEPLIALVTPASLDLKVHGIRFQTRFKFVDALLGTEGRVECEFSKNQVLGWVTAAACGGGFLATKHFTLHNIFAISLSVQAIRFLSIGKFVIGFILLWGLFIYDVFWVFGTDVMMTVAKNIEGPVKLILPYSFEPWRNSILGLGDIVIPGVFVAMCLRFDDAQHRLKQKLKVHRENVQILEEFEKPYFRNVMVAYLAGLLVTGLIMVAFNTGQPALLYLVPATTGACFFTALYRGELTQLWSYDEACEERKETAEDRKKQ